MRFFRYQIFAHHAAQQTALFISLVTFLLLLPLTVLAAETEKTAEQQCGEAKILYRDDPALSRAERLVLMEKAFYDSINRFEACKLASQSSASSASNSGGGGEYQGDGLSENSATASQEMQGTEAELEIPPPMAEQDLQNIQSGNIDSPASANNGAVPEDIPAANNDDAIAAQIRLAAEAETDPEIRQKLWNEYRKYKGLDVVE